MPQTSIESVIDGAQPTKEAVRLTSRVSSSTDHDIERQPLSSYLHEPLSAGNKLVKLPDGPDSEHASIMAAQDKISSEIEDIMEKFDESCGGEISHQLSKNI
ncbi:hypothetical protein BKA67DRAFT_560030, partial [Truncatella angustata]